jgi:hypothetical protein
MKALALAGWFLVLGWGQTAYAWGDEGHRITGYVANALLSDTTRQRLRALVGTDDLAQIATWMDDEREALNQRLPGSSRWHYENRPACDEDRGTARVCPNGQCLTRQIERSTIALQNRDARVAQRAEAVRILVHLLGDLHQPLHLIDNNDRGGNDVLVRLPREHDPRRLHEVWDTRFVHMNTNRRSEEDYGSMLVARFQSEFGSWELGSVDQWAADTYQLAKLHAYSPLPGFACGNTNSPAAITVLPASYIQDARGIVDAQLAKAGVRIAVVLNRALGKS